MKHQRGFSARMHKPCGKSHLADANAFVLRSIADFHRKGNDGSSSSFPLLLPFISFSDSVAITFSDTLVLQAGTDMCSGCIYTATASVAKKEMKGFWLLAGISPQQGTIELKQTG